MERKRLIKNIYGRLRRLVLDDFHRSFEGYRQAGALEALLVEDGYLKPDLSFQYRSGGKKYFLFIDTRWTESYPSMICRVTEEYLLKNP